MSWYSRFEEPEQLSLEERPTFRDLERNAEAGIVKRGLARYLFTHNPDRSIKMHTMLGTPVVRSVVMGAVGRIFSPGSGGIYRTDHSRSRLEAATNFAVRGSVLNEAIHTVFGVPATAEAVMSAADGRFGTGFILNAVGAGVNLSLVALQRYNRAKMIKRADEQLEAGNQFRPDYENWLGIDARAVENYRTTLPEQIMEESSSVEQMVSAPNSNLPLPSQQY